MTDNPQPPRSVPAPPQPYPPAQIEALVAGGISPQGAMQLLGGEILSRLGDRLRLRDWIGTGRNNGNDGGDGSAETDTALDDAIDGDVPLSSSPPGPWGLSPLGTQQLLAGLPILAPRDRTRLAEIVVAALGVG